MFVSRRDIDTRRSKASRVEHSPSCASLVSTPSVREIRDRLAALVALHANADPKHINAHESIWDAFPPNPPGIEHPSVAAFLDDVQTRFGVYLREEDTLDGPSIETLAHIVREKIEHPELSLAHRATERHELTRGLWIALAYINIGFVPLAFVATMGTLRYKAAVALGIGAFLTVSTVLVFRKEREGARSSSTGESRRQP
jgi:hypothetical protein